MIRHPCRRAPADTHILGNLRDLFPTLIDLANVPSVLQLPELDRSAWRTRHDATFYGYDSYHGPQFKLRSIRTGRYKYNWSPHDLDELCDLEADPGERINLAGDPQMAQTQQALERRLRAWMDDEGDYLCCAAHLPRPGSHIDGRSSDDQHDPGTWTDAERSW